MNFEFKGHSGSGHSYCPSNFDNLSWYDNTPLKFKTTLIPVIKKPDTVYPDKKQLELTWLHWLFYKETEVFYFHSYTEYYISDDINEPAKTLLTDIISKSHSHLQSSFDERRREFYIFEAISPLTEDAIQQTVSQLHSFLHKSL